MGLSMSKRDHFREDRGYITCEAFVLNSDFKITAINRTDEQDS